uniref:DNA repair exonuclease n=1 Tax=Dictyoglomus thermophilum TaxID=14 RepID=A0A7C3MJL9_DICTH
MIKILITADNHLGKYYKKLVPERLNERRRKIREAFKKTVDYAIEEKVDIFIQAGDLFDSTNPRNQDLAFVAREFSRLKRNYIQIYTIGGNHDAPNMIDSDAFPMKIYEEVGLIKSFLSQSNINVDIFEKDQKLIISGLSHDPRKKGRIDPLENIKLSDSIPQDNNIWKILILHYSFEKYAHPKSSEPQVSLHTLYSLPFNIYILGHLHEKNIYKFGDKILIIPGSTERFDFGEIDLTPGFYLLKIEGKKIDIIHEKIEPQPMKIMEIKLSEITEKDYTNAIIEKILRESQKDLMLKCKIVGEIPISIYSSINFSKILDEGLKANFLFDLDTQNLRIKGKEISIIPSEDFSFEKNLSKITEKYLEENKEDQEAIIEAVKWIREELKIRGEFL